MKRILGTVTIGQSPRTDVTPDLRAILGDGIDIVEAGALDGLSRDEIASLAPETGDYVLVTRLADGSSVQVAEKYIAPRVEARIAEHFANGLSIVLLLCTGEFPDFPTDGLLLRPQRILYNTVEAVAKGLRVGFLTPSRDQIAQSGRRWKSVCSDLRVVPASPYADAERAVRAAAAEMKEWGADLTVMDCMGYTLAMQEAVREVTDRPVILARGIVARVVRELIG